MSKRSSSTSIAEFVKRRKLDVIGYDTDLDNHQFEIAGLSWRLDRHGEVMRSQQVNVQFQNSLILSDAVLNDVKAHRWNGHRQVRRILRYHLSNGPVYEIFWKTYPMTLPQLLPPNGRAYTLVAEFLLNEQRLLDERAGTASGSSDSGSSDSGSPGPGSGTSDSGSDLPCAPSVDHYT